MKKYIPHFLIIAAAAISILLFPSENIRAVGMVGGACQNITQCPDSFCYNCENNVCVYVKVTASCLMGGGRFGYCVSGECLPTCAQLYGSWCGPDSYCSGDKFTQASDAFMYPNQECCFTDPEIGTGRCFPKASCQDKGGVWCDKEKCAGSDITRLASGASAHPGQICCAGVCRKPCAQLGGAWCPQGLSCSVANDKTSLASDASEHPGQKCCAPGNTCSAVPPAPTLSSPANGATGVSLNPPLDWSDTVAPGGWYHLYYKKSSESQWSTVGNLTPSQYQFSLTLTLAGDTSYQWYVRACNSGALCSDSVTWSFKTVGSAAVGTPSVPTLSSPANGATSVSLNPTLDWSDTISSGGWYTLYYKKSSEVPWLVVDSLTPSQYQFSLALTLAGNTSYQWYVHACNPGALCSPDSATWSFTTVGAPSGGTSGGIKISLSNPLHAKNFNELVGKLINFIFTIGVILAPLMYLVAGIYIVAAAGDPQKVTTGKNIILYTTIGLGILLFARGLIYVIRSALGG